MTNEKPKFETLRASAPLSIGNKTYYISEQKIVQQPSGNSSLHIVVKKQPMNEDGSPQGQSKQLFIPVDDASLVLKSIQEFITSKK